MAAPSSQATPKRRVRIDYDKLMAEVDAELDAMFGAEERQRWREDSAVDAATCRKEREEKAQTKRDRLSHRILSQHPNRGKTSGARGDTPSGIQGGRWMWSEEVPVSPAEVRLPPYPNLLCRASGVRAKREHRLRVHTFEHAAASELATLNGHPTPDPTVSRWDHRERQEIEADVNRRWTNAQQRIRRRGKRKRPQSCQTRGS